MANRRSQDTGSSSRGGAAARGRGRGRPPNAEVEQIIQPETPVVLPQTQQELQTMIAEAVRTALQAKDRADKGKKVVNPEPENLEISQTSKEGEGEKDLNKALEDKMEAMNAQWHEMMKKMTGQQVPMPKGVPFTKEVTEAPLPKAFHSAVLPEYNGNTDPEEHLNRVKNAALLYNFSDGVRCRILLTTLCGTAMVWFNQLKENSITSFEDFEILFLTQFASSRKVQKTAMHLMSIKQREKENLKTYIQRFKDAALEIPNANPAILTQALCMGLRNDEFYKSLAKKPASTFTDLLNRAEKYINMEEALKARNFEPESKGRDKKISPPEPKKEEPRGVRKKYDTYSPLTTVPSQILLSIEKTENLRENVKWPFSRRDGPRKQKSDKFCRFHQEYGHTTDQCGHLKDEIERLVREGKLEEYLSKESKKDGGSYLKDRIEVGRKDSPEQAYPHKERRIETEHRPESSSRRIINMISGGPVDGDSNRARRAHSRIAHPSCVNLVKQEEKEIRPVIQFRVEDGAGLSFPHHDALVITALLSNWEMKRIFVDCGSSADILFFTAYQKMGLEVKDLESINTPLVGFAGEVVHPLGKTTLPLTLGTTVQQMRKIEFLVVDAPSAYNVILGRPTLNAFKAVISTLYLSMKFPAGDQVGVARGDQYMARNCYVAALKEKMQKDDQISPSRKRVRDVEESNHGIEKAKKEDLKGKEKIKPVEELMEIQIGEADETTRIGTKLNPTLKEGLILLLKKYKDVFAWAVEQLGRIDPTVITHHLNVDPQVKPVKQKRRIFNAEKDAIIRAEVERLLDAGQIVEIQFPAWLSNVVLVPKKEQKWRMCVDFRDLNKACPKDSYPLPKIDLLVDSTAGCALLSMMDAQQGYHQILLSPEDQAKVSFITSKGTYCYIVMPFGLKNAGATYQRLMDEMFKSQIGRNMQVYVDDIMVKSRTEDEHLGDLEETFQVLREYGMKLNPGKCAFGVQSGKFLGYMVTPQGIEVNPEKIRAIMEMPTPKTEKEVQRLAGRVAALSRFISRSGDRGGPFFKVLRKVGDCKWSPECDVAFRQLKEYLSSPPVLTKPEAGEELFLYLAVTGRAVSSVLVREDGGIQKPIYYVSKVLVGAEQRYLEIEKLALAVVITVRKLRPYFLAHSVTVLTEQPLKKILENPESSGRLVKWTVELSGYDISYKPRPAIKSQVLADFLAEMNTPIENTGQKWNLWVDGAANTAGSGAGVYLVSPQGDELEFAVRITYKASNNEAEYEAVVCGLELAKQAGAKCIEVFSDSQLIIQQIGGECEIKNEKMKKLHDLVTELKKDFEKIVFQQIPRSANGRADALAKLASTLEENKDRQITVMSHPILKDVIAEIEEGEFRPDWRTEIQDWIVHGKLPEDKAQATALKQKATRFTMIGDQLYKKSYSQVLIRCIPWEEVKVILKEVHEGGCGMHLAGRSLVKVILRAGYFWPTMLADANEAVKRCDNCQRHARLTHMPAELMHPLVSPSPFAQWGLDIVGPFPPGEGQKRYLLVGVDYFTKWVEVEATIKIGGKQILDFIWKNIVSRFGLPRVLICDNGKQYHDKAIRIWCESTKVKQVFASVAYPQCNGQVEVSNRTIVEGIKYRLGRYGKDWVDQIASVIWAYRTTPRTTTGETPFSLVYGMEALIPVEISQESERFRKYNPQSNEEDIREELDLIEERRDAARIRMETYRKRMMKRYNKRVRPRDLQVGDWVLKESSLFKVRGKLEANWEGPYRVTAVLGSGAYRIANIRGKEEKNTWNISRLKKYFF